MRELSFYIIAGENSGDRHGANMVRAAKRLYPNCRWAGLGGDFLADAGVTLDSNITKDLAIIGLAGVLKNLPRIREVFDLATNHLRENRPDALVLVDYPGFNIRMAARAKALGIPVIWYISPQVWAWHESRKFKLAKLVSKMIVIFPFEKAIYEELKMDVAYVGHPLFDAIRIDQTKGEAYAAFGLDPDRPLVTVIPGSRDHEVENFLDIMLEGARRYHEINPRAQFAIIRATTITPSMIEKRVKKAALPFGVPIVDRFRYNLRAHCDFSWVKSGTSTLESAIIGGPMLIVYRVNPFTWVIGKQLFKMPYIGLPNIVAGDRIVPELLQEEFTAERLAEVTHEYVDDAVRYARMVRDLENVRVKLGGPGASERAAREVLDAVGAKPVEAPAP